MKKDQDRIALPLRGRTVYATQSDAVRLLGVHPKTAQRWARGTQRPSAERVALLAILTGQMIPMPGWDGFRFEVRRGPAPNRSPFAVLVGPDGREWLASDFEPLAQHQARKPRPWWAG